MRPLYSKHLHSDISFSIGEANFCRTNLVNFKEAKREHRDKQILPTGVSL